MVVWVFGYGSLMWKPGFDYDRKIVGYVKGYKRVFHQGNTDHRGTPELPGRTVNLEPDPESICWGVAYCISTPEKKDVTLSYLEFREKEYDLRAFVDLYTDLQSNQPAISGVLVYLASTDRNKNKYYLGTAPIEDMAWQIATASGPSGSNAEYLFMVHRCLHEIGCEEEDLAVLVDEVKRLLN